jgi:hypothetical protein
MQPFSARRRRHAHAAEERRSNPVAWAKQGDILFIYPAGVGWRARRKSGAFFRWRGLIGAMLFIYRATPE